MESKLYVITEIEEKDLGCVALKEIKRGTLILREKPCFLLGELPDLEDLNKDYFDDIFHGYEKMNSHQKDQFFELANAYEHIERTNNYHNDSKKISLNYLKEHPKPYPDGFALKVIQITETNRFHNGVFLEMSRFNHSCVSNAEYFWNEDRNTRDVRAIKKITKGEEITTNYFGKMDTDIHRDQRRMHLFKSHNFTCFCNGCDLSDKQLKVQNRLSDEFERLMNKKNEFQAKNAYENNSDMSEEVRCLKDLYKTAQDLKFFRRSEILTRIVEEGFNSACKGYLTKNLVEEKKSAFWKDICTFANDGLEISTTIHGADHSETIEWRERKEHSVKDFEECVLGGKKSKKVKKSKKNKEDPVEYFEEAEQEGKNSKKVKNIKKNKKATK